MHYTNHYFLILSLITTLCQSLDFPASFTVVRNIVTPISIDNFMQQIGCCKNDSYGNSASYSVASLDGFQALSTPATLQSGVTPLSIWLNAFQRIGALKVGKGGSSTSSLQQYILNYLHQNGVKLFLNAFADEAPISNKKVDAQVTAQNLINIVNSAQLDGVSIQFVDYHSVASGTASLWLSQLLTALRSGLQKKEIVLILPVTFVNRVSLLQQSLISGLVDMFVLRYYGFSKEDYTSYNSLFNTSSAYPQTAFAELLKSSSVGINLCRTLIAKSPNSNINSYMTASSLSSAFQTAYNTFGWFGGYANLDFQADSTSSYQIQVMSQLRSVCRNSQNCFCP